MAYIQLWSSTCKLLQREEVRNDDHIDNSSSVVFARWRRVGIFSLARVASTNRLTCSAGGARAKTFGVHFSTASHCFWITSRRAPVVHYEALDPEIRTAGGQGV